MRPLHIYCLRLALAFSLLCAIPAAAATETILHTFSSQQRGTWPVGLVIDSSGNLFGTTQYGGTYNNGVVYKFAPKLGGGWTQTVLHSFTGGADSSHPLQLVLDAAGNIYGTTANYGPGNCPPGCGTAFKLSPNSTGGWDYSILYTFQSGDGSPTGALVLDSSGNLYGPTANYTTNTGSVFKLTLSGATWTETILYTFSGGRGPTITGLAFDNAANLYGTLTNNASATNGLVFELIPSGANWTEKDLYAFLGGSTGGVPTGNLLFHKGNLYGTTLQGGSTKCGCGVVFELHAGSNGQWSENVVYTLQGSGYPIFPTLSAFDPSGNLYGLTYEGGSGGCNWCGSVFQLTTNSSGSWTERDLWDFDGSVTDGDYPTALALGPAGQLYGTTTGPILVFPKAEIFELKYAPGGQSTLRVLYAFPFTDGEEPHAGLTPDTAGNLYGSTYYGGRDNVGSIYKLSPTASGWNESLIYSFPQGPNTTYYTNSPSGLTFDAKGNLYGTTQFGGALVGTAFELSPQAGGGWREKDLVTFNHIGPSEPVGGVVFDQAGRIYGVTYKGGGYGFGTVYRLTRRGTQWETKVIHSFGGYPSDGGSPQAGLTIDSAGNLYGTTTRGGSGQCAPQSGSFLGCGTVFKLSYAAGSGWTETVLYSFQGTHAADGSAPLSNLILDASGNLYGTTNSGGIGNCSEFELPPGCGTVFELSPSSAGWNETILYEFVGRPDGENPAAPLLWDHSGNLYGTTVGGGGIYSSGAVYKLAPAGGGGWTESLIYSFGTGNDGNWPQSPLIFDAVGNLYGTTIAGGAYGGTSNSGEGIVFEITP
jgi:uncharacterized repeat protein (TIGR03803 family)